MFAGIGSMLFVKDKIRRKADAENSAPETEAAAPASAAAAETPAAPEPVVAETVAAETVAAETVAAETTAVPDVTTGPETTAAAEPAAAPEAIVAPAAAALPLANYDELTIASLRARLRNLTADQLTGLIGYEKEHANREDVISMFERRITKLNLGLTQALPKITE
jgi:hypothetical protein